MFQAPKRRLEAELHYMLCFLCTAIDGDLDVAAMMAACSGAQFECEKLPESVYE